MIKRKFKQYRGFECLNCETPLDVSEKYCHHCGQLNSTKKLTISDFFEEFLSNFYAYDSRLRNSLISLFSKPGILAKEFNEGKRQKYANPFRLFLSVSILLFIFHNLDKKPLTLNLEDSQKTLNTQTETIEKEINAISDSIPSIDTSILKDKVSSLKNIEKDSIYNKSQLEKNAFRIYYRISSFRNFNIKYPEKTESEALKELGYENDRFNRYFYNKSIHFKSNNIKEELGNYFLQKLPFLIFLSLPIITIMFWLVFYSKKLNFTEHLIFSYSFFTFLFICMLLFNLIALISEPFSRFLIGFSFLIAFPIYFYKSLRNFYEQNRWKTVLKFILLNPLFGLFLIISFLIMISLGIILF